MPVRKREAEQHRPTLSADISQDEMNEIRELLKDLQERVNKVEHNVLDIGDMVANDRDLIHKHQNTFHAQEEYDNE